MCYICFFLLSSPTKRNLVNINKNGNLPWKRDERLATQVPIKINNQLSRDFIMM